MVADAEQAARVKKGSDHAGVLIDIAVAAAGTLPHPDAAFDVAVVHSASAMLARLDAPTRLALLRESARVLRAGGRVIVIEAGTPTGLRSLLKAAPASQATYDAAGGVLGDLRAAGFAPVRSLGDREGLRFAEGLKPSEASPR